MQLSGQRSSYLWQYIKAAEGAHLLVSICLPQNACVPRKAAGMGKRRIKGAVQQAHPHNLMACYGLSNTTCCGSAKSVHVDVSASNMRC